MKLKYIIVTLLASLILFGCEKEQFKAQLDEVQVSSSYITLPEAGGNKTITIAATDSWQFKDLPAWLTASPASGSAGESTITFSSVAQKDNSEANIKIVCGGVEQTIYVYQPGDPALQPQFPEFAEGDYWIMFKEGIWKVAKPVGSSASYGWLYAQDAIDKAGVLSSTAATVFTFKKVDGGFTIQDADKRFYHMPGSYDSFNVIKDRQSDKSDVWTVEQISNTEFLVVNVMQGKTLQYDPAYSSFGAYGTISDSKIKPYLVKAEAPAPELIAISTLEYNVGLEAGTLNVPATINSSNIFVDTHADWISYKGIQTVDSQKCLVFGYTDNAAGARSTKIAISASEDGVTAEVEITVSQEGSVIDATADVIKAAEDGATQYRITGYVSSIANTQYGNLYIKDATGEVYVYGVLDADGKTKNFSSLGIKAGDIITVVGPKSSYNGSPQMVNVSVEKHFAVTEVSVADFLAKEVGTDYFQMTGVVSNIKNTTYGNFDIEDETGKVYVYGLAPGFDALKKFNKAFETIGIKEGDKVTIVGQRAAYNGTAQVGAAFFVKKEAAPAGNVYTVTAEPLPTKYPTEETTFTVGAIQYKEFNVANYGSGIQFKKKDGDVSGGYITNVTPIKNIKKIKLTWHADKAFYPDNLALSSGEKTFTPTVDNTAKTMEYDLSSGAYTQFKVQNTSGYAAYLSSIEITYAE